MLRLAVVLAAALALAAPAQAAVSAVVTVEHSRFVARIGGARAKAVTVVAAGRSYKLFPSGSKWRSRPVPAAPAAGGSRVKVKVRTSSGTKVLTVTIAGPALPPDRPR